MLTSGYLISLILVSDYTTVIAGTEVDNKSLVRTGGVGLDDRAVDVTTGIKVFDDTICITKLLQMQQVSYHFLSYCH